MQQLQFEASWDKALSAQDRDQIEKLFNETKEKHFANIVFSPIREAINHRNELLITVLVHNFSAIPLTFENTRLVYLNEQMILAEKLFTLPALVIPPKVSMPWTFIFPQGNYRSGNSNWAGRLQIQFDGKMKHLHNVDDYCLTIYAEQIHSHQQFDEWTFHSMKPVLSFRHKDTNDSFYWQLDWFEDEPGSDYLLIEEQTIPTSIDYHVDQYYPDQYFIIGSSFSFEDNVIKKVTGYGYKGETLQVFDTIVFEFEQSFLLIKAGPLISGVYTKTPPVVNREILFTF
ncbi:SLAP domain-containing protein [Solibacillus sp. CAU 1738]|uniref:SLAP domain-containing protein n=1 Tax=Solibacillus sp. CAU 1738 TaxID=3140363 RepID=UPI0032614B2C